MLDVDVTSATTRIDLRWARHFDHALIEALEAALDRAEAASSARVVFENSGPDFLVGIDARWVVERILDDDLPAIIEFVERGQRFLRRLDRTPCRTVARVRGHVTGAGAEWVAACDTVIATGDVRIGLPETGLGIHPALGGTQRVPRRIGHAAARWAILTGSDLDTEGARRLGWIDAVGDEVDVARRPARVAHAPARHAAFHDETLAAFATRSLDELLAGPRPDDGDAVRRALRRVARRAPVAREVADRLLDRSRTDDLETGLRAEIEALATVYATDDALTGMRAGAEGRRAARFRGR